MTTFMRDRNVSLQAFHDLIKNVQDLEGQLLHMQIEIRELKKCVAAVAAPVKTMVAKLEAGEASRVERTGEASRVERSRL